MTPPSLISQAPLPISIYQKRFWLEWARKPNSSTYNVSAVYKLIGHLDRKALKQACALFIERHEVIHSRFSEDGELNYNGKFNVDAFYFEIKADTTKTSIVQISNLLNIPFISIEDPFLRLYLLSGEKEDYFIINAQHTIIDGASIKIISKEICAIYNAIVEENNIPISNSCSFTEYVNSEKEFLNKKNSNQSSNFWREFLKDVSLSVKLPSSHIVKFIEGEGETIYFRATEEQAASIRKIANQNHTTSFVVLLSLYVFNLSKYINKNQFVISYPVNMRSKEYAKIIGCFVNNLPLKINLDSKDTYFSDLIKHIDIQRKEVAPHSWYPLTNIIQDLRKTERWLESDILNIGFAETNLNVLPISLNKINTENMEIPWSNQSIYHLCLQYDFSLENTICFRVEYQKNNLDFYLVNSFINSFKNLLQKIVNEDFILKDHCSLTQDECQKIFYHWNQPKAYPNNMTLHELFELQVKKSENAIALLHEDISISYGELNRKANQLARCIQLRLHEFTQASLHKKSFIALYLDRGIEQVISILAILKAGEAYVPIAVGHPSERVKHIVEDSGVRIILTQTAHLKTLQDFLENPHDIEFLLVDANDSFDQNSENLPIRTLANDIAYVIYTSGTTGQPKGVLQPHSNVMRLFTSTEEEFNFSSNDVWTMYHSYAFDFSVWEMWGALIYGGKLFLPTQQQARNIPEFYALCLQHKVTVLNQTPTAFYQFLQIAEQNKQQSLTHLRYIILGGEALNLSYLKNWWKYVKENSLQTQIINMYGITETTVHVTLKRVSANDDEKICNIGKPLGDLFVYILSEEMKPVPIGVIGELYVGGAGLAAGYLNRPDLTQERFVHNPFEQSSDIFQSRLYKTGDLVRYLHNGELEYIGRNDSQIKIRGYRVEIREIERALLNLQYIKKAVVFVEKIQNSNLETQHLIAYYVSENEIESSLLFSEISKVLPEYMVPSEFIHLYEFPKTINGKIDEKILAKFRNNHKEARSFPRNETERSFLSVWEELLSKKIETYDDFFGVGGDSILVVMMVAKLKDKGIGVSVQDVFELRTIARLSEIVTRAIDIKPYFYSPFSLLSKSEIETIGLKDLRSIEDIFPASYLQLGMLLESKHKYEDGTYHDVFIYSIYSSLDLNKVRSIWQDLVNKHPMLRSSFVEHPKYGYCILQYRSILIDEKINEVAQEDFEDFVEKEKSFSLILSSPGVFKIYVSKKEKNKFSIMFSFHHAIADGWSVASLIAEFCDAYVHAKPIIMDKHPVYGEFIKNEKLALDNEELYKFWKNYLSAREVQQENFIKNTSSLKDRVQIECSDFLDIDLSCKLQSYAEKNSVSVDIIFMSVFVVVLSIFGGSSNVTFGLVVNNRLENTGGEKTFGLYLNTIPFRVTLLGKTKLSIIKLISDEKTKVYKYKSYPYAKMKSDSNLKKDFYQCAFNYINFHISDNLQRDNVLDIESRFEKTNIPLTFNCIKHADKFEINLKGLSPFVDPLIMKRMLDYLYYYLTQVTNEEDFFPLLIPEDYRRILECKNRLNTYSCNQTLHELFELQVKKSENAIALLHEDISISYGELNRKANQLARCIQLRLHEFTQASLHKKSFIALYLDRGIEQVISILAILKAGEAYVPIAVGHPSERVKHIVEDSGVRIILTQTAHLKTLQDFLENPHDIEFLLVDANDSFDQNSENLPIRTLANDIAYVIYTSGTTGQPKGVLQPHSNVMRLFTSTEEEFNFSSNDVWTMYHSYAFDFSVWEMWGALIYGGKLFLPTQQQARNIPEFYALCLQHKVTVLNQTPTAFYQFLQIAEQNKQQSLTHLRYIILGGEALNLSYLKNWWKYVKENSLQTQIINMYGITETTVHVTLKRVSANDDEKICNIGKPLGDLFVYILSEEMKPVPIGVIGELYVGGAGLAAGYLNRPDLTQERFVHNPFEQSSDIFQSRLYKTGDLVRYLHNGELEYIGRNDSQIKIRGYRIERKEIENVLSSLFELGQYCLLEEILDDSQVLTCYYTNALSRNTLERIQNKMRLFLPEYMMPSYWREIPQLPLTINGKIDINALKQLFLTKKESVPVEEGSSLHKAILAVWQEVLPYSDIQLDDNFFDVGGNSIKILSLHILLRKKFCIDGDSVIDLFEYPSIRKYANFISEKYPTLVREFIE